MRDPRAGYFTTPELHTDDLVDLLRGYREQRATVSLDPQFCANGQWRGRDNNLVKVSVGRFPAVRVCL